MKHIFVSYSRKDRKTVDHIVARLIEDGLEVWIDREEITGGELWRESIVKAIETTVNAEYEQETGLRRPIRFIDESGKPIALKPGHTWVYVMSYDSTLSERSPDQWFARFVAPAGSK